MKFVTLHLEKLLLRIHKRLFFKLFFSFNVCSFRTMIGSQTTSTIAEDSVASGTGGGGGGGAGGRIFVISDKNFRSSSFDQGRTGGTATTGN